MIYSFRPYIPEHIDMELLLSEISGFFNIEHGEVATMWQTYEAFSRDKNYKNILGEGKTLSTEEAFIIFIVLSFIRPRTIVEIGTEWGRSTRRIIDMKNILNIDGEIICFDINNQVKYFTPDEATLIVKDITWTFSKDVLNVYDPGFIFLDAHPYYLIKNVVQTILNESKLPIAIHDSSKGLCNPYMTISKDDPTNISSSTGVWERHVLAEIFNIENVLSDKLDDVETASHRLRIFSTKHGLSVILPKTFMRI